MIGKSAMADNTASLNDLKDIKPIVLIGLMGAGKSRIGRELAAKLKLPFVDADDEIVKAAGCSVSDIFELYGETAFRDVERKVIFRLLEDRGKIISTGGGAFMNEDIRRFVAERGISVWLRAKLDVLVERTGRRGGRPLLEKGDPKAILQGLMDERYPVYGGADIIIDTEDVSVDVTVNEAAAALSSFVAKREQK
jgi:shikimate kinase